MYSTEVFYYIQKQIVVLLSGSSTRSYMPVYSKTLKLNKGVDNQIQFQFLNQAQKHVDITDKTIICRLISYDGNRLLLEKKLTLVFALNGICTLDLTSADIQDIPAQKCYYSLEIDSSTNAYPVYVDPTGGARGDIDIIDSVLPKFVNSYNVTIPSQLFPNTVYANGVNLCSILSGNTVTYNTSVIISNGSPITTLQASYINYTGNVIIEGSTAPDGGWYTVSNNYTYANLTNTEGYVVSGYHPYIRMTFIAVDGDVERVLKR